MSIKIIKPIRLYVLVIKSKIMAPIEQYPDDIISRIPLLFPKYFYCCLFLSWARFPVIAWKPDLILATEHRDPQVSHCKKNNLVSFCRIVSGDRQVWQVTYSSVDNTNNNYFLNIAANNRIEKWQCFTAHLHTKSFVIDFRMWLFG